MPVLDTPKHDTIGHCDVTDIESVAVYREEKEEVTIFAVNRNIHEDITLSCDLRSFAGYDILEHIIMEEGDLKTVNAYGRERVLPKNSKESDMDEGILTAKLHKASWNVIRLGKQGR